MAATVHDTIRLDTDLTGQLPTNEYGVLHEGLEHLREPLMQTERSLTGHMHIHRVLDGSDPMVVQGERLKLLLEPTEFDTLIADLGKVVYYMPHRRDESDPTTYRRVMLFRQIESIENVDPNITWYRATIILEDATGNSV